MNNAVKVIGGILLGAAIGITAGVLVAPASGNRTKKMVKRQSKKYARQALELANDYIAQARKGYNRRVEGVAENGKHSIENIKDAIRI